MLECASRGVRGHREVYERPRIGGYIRPSPARAHKAVRIFCLAPPIRAHRIGQSAFDTLRVIDGPHHTICVGPAHTPACCDVMAEPAKTVRRKRLAVCE